MTLCIGKYRREKISDKYLLLFLKNCGIILSAIRSRLGQRLGQKKAAHKNGTYEKQKSSKSDDFEGFWYAVRDSNPRPSGP